eukprot:10688358-Lingulodinium_polyedra.AAC.1
MARSRSARHMPAVAASMGHPACMSRSATAGQRVSALAVNAAAACSPAWCRPAPPLHTSRKSCTAACGSSWTR